MRRYLFYSPANMNSMSGSAVWTQSVAEILHRDEEASITMLLREPAQRELLTAPLRRLPRLTLLEPREIDPHVPNSRLTSEWALDLIEHLDQSMHFDVILLRGFSTCAAGARRPQIQSRLWSTYVLEPERDTSDAKYVAQLESIAQASRFVVVQSEAMRGLLESIVPGARGKTLILPPAVPTSSFTKLDLKQGVPQRLIYAGKYHPFYAVPELIEAFSAAKTSLPNLVFDLYGDQIAESASGGDWGRRLREQVGGQPGVRWHGAVSREVLEGSLHGGGVGLSVWDHRYGSAMNDLVISTKLLDYCNAGIPVVLNRTAAQEQILGVEYPLFVDSIGEVLPQLMRVLSDKDLYERSARMCAEAAKGFSYEAVSRALIPFLAGSLEVGSLLAARPKLPGAEWRIGIPMSKVEDGVTSALLVEIQSVLQRDPRIHLVIGVSADSKAADSASGEDPAAVHRSLIPDPIRSRVSFQTVTDPWNWWRTLGVIYRPKGIRLDERIARIGHDSKAEEVESLLELDALFCS
jgi:glycosyltransferase involved in cell wall biosynthesis